MTVHDYSGMAAASPKLPIGRGRGRRPARGRPPESSGTDTAQRIRDTAMRLFYEKGFHETSVRDISNACGLTPGALYNHFRSKDDVLYSIMQWSHDELDRDLADALESSGTAAPARLHAAVRAFVLRHTKYREAARVANREYGSLSHDRKNEVVVRRRQTRALFQRLIGDITITNGTAVVLRDSIKKWEDEITAMAVINLMIMVAEWYNEDGPLTGEAVADLHADLVLRLVSGR